jgi:hypothetical protein
MKISVGALCARINRKLAYDGEALGTSHGTRMQMECGTHYILDVNRIAIVDKDIDLETYGREVGVLTNAHQVSIELERLYEVVLTGRINAAEVHKASKPLIARMRQIAAEVKGGDLSAAGRGK